MLQNQPPSLAASKMMLKLLVDRQSSKVLFAEADKAFVDYLFTILALPLGTVTRLLKQSDGMVGSLGVLYESIEGLSDSYIHSHLSKEAVLCPKVKLPSGDKNVPLLECDGVAYAVTKLYRCSHCRSSKVSDIPQTRCPSCSNAMSDEVTFLNPSAPVDYADTHLYMCGHCFSKYVSEKSETCPSCRNYMKKEITYLDSSSAETKMGGYVKEVITYMVMDDLAVKPMSTISSITLLNTFNIKDVGVLEEKIVSLGMAEGLKLLQASLQSKTVLTDVFLRKAKV